MMTEVYRKRLCSMVHFRVPQLFSLYFQHSIRSLYQKTITTENDDRGFTEEMHSEIAINKTGRVKIINRE